MTISYFKLSALKLARENTRKTRPSEQVQTLAASIEVVGILHTLVGYEYKGKVHITDGGTRLNALRLLEKQKADVGKLLTNIPVNLCSKDHAIDMSLTANLVRSAMNVTDQFTAFHKLHHLENVHIKDIAKRYFVDTQTVKRILKLASLAKPIFEALKQEEITLDVAKAYAGCADTDRQLTVFEQCGTGASAYAVRSALRENTYLADSAKVAFVGLQNYLDKGGVVEEDLFESNIICLNGEIIDELMAEAVEVHTQNLLDEGWREVHFFENCHALYDATHKQGQRIWAKCHPTPTQQKEMDGLSDKIEALGYYWGLDDAQREDYDALKKAHDEIEQAASSFSDEEKATGILLWHFDENGPQYSTFALKEDAPTSNAPEKEMRDYPESFERHVMAAAGDALMEHLTRNPNIVTTSLAIAALEFSYFPALKVSISSRPKLKFNRGVDLSGEAEETVANPWDLRPSDMIERVKELVQMSEAERQSVLASLLREGFSMGEGATDLKDQMALFHYLGDESGFTLTDYWAFAETELKSLTKAQLLRILGTLGLSASSFSKAKKSELVTVTARYAKENNWTPEFLRKEIDVSEELVVEPKAQKAA